MQSVLEALGNNLVTSPLSKIPPSSSLSSSSLTDVANAPPTRDHIYDTIPLTDTSQTSNTSPGPQKPSAQPSSGPDYIYDTVPLRNRQQSLTVSGESHYAVPRPVSTNVTSSVSPSTRRRGSQPNTQHHNVDTSESPSPDERHSIYDVPRSASRSSTSSPQSSPALSNKHHSHYDVPNPINTTCVSPCQSSPTQSPSWSSNERRLHYDTPPRPVPTARRPPSQVGQQHAPTSVVTRQESPSPVQMRRSSSDSTILDTVQPGTPPPVKPRPSPNVSRRKVRTLDRSSGLNMNDVMSELRARTSTMSTTGKPGS